MLAEIGSGLNSDRATAGNTEVLKSKINTMTGVSLKDTIAGMLNTLGSQYHLIRLIPHKRGLFLYCALDSSEGDLAMARLKFMDIEKDISV
jgi:hypothetical protein